MQTSREKKRKKCGEPLSWRILQYTNNFIKGRAANFEQRVTLSQNVFHMGYGFPEQNSISGATSLNSLKKECLEDKKYENKYSIS